MDFKFYLYDYTNGDGKTAVEIVEPIGFDAISLKIRRHPTYKGVNMEYSEDELEIDDKKGFLLIKKAYEKLGINAQVVILMKYRCSNTGVFKELYRGNLSFSRYKEIYDSYCSIKITVEPLGCVMDWRNRDQIKVDLQSLKAFDGITDLQPYDKLGFEVEMPSKAILIRSEADTEKLATNFSSNINDNFGGNWTGVINTFFFLPFSNNKIGEVEVFIPETDWTIHNNSMPIDKSYENAFFNSNNNEIECLSLHHLVLKSRGSLVIDTIAGILPNSLKFILVKNNGVDSPTVIINELVTPLGGHLHHIFEWDINYDNNIDIKPKESLVCYLYFQALKGTSGNFDKVEIVHQEGSCVSIELLSKCNPTPCKQFMINEALSRIVEASTNNCMRVYSDYFGRTDAQPYPSLQDGCGSLTSITKGLFIRQIEKSRTENTLPVFSLSFKEVFEALDAIYNIGLQIEPDPNRQGHELLRIEDINYFYRDEVVLDLSQVSYELQIKREECFSKYVFGYEKWEAEEYNGLDEFLTKREYKTNINENMQFEKISKFIASGYAIEVTRRKSTDQTKDWRYDEDTFIVCLKRSGGNIVVEQGAISGAENIIDPPTLYNIKISPVRNALRWVKEIFKGFKNQNNAKIDFTAGDGNYFAKGKYTGNCVLEANVLQENQTIDMNTFADNSLIIPFTTAERIVIQDLPLSYEMYLKLKENPLGIIRIKSKNGENIDTYLDTLDYSLLEGSCDFSLIPKY